MKVIVIHHVTEESLEGIEAAALRDDSQGEAPGAIYRLPRCDSRDHAVAREVSW